MAVKSYLERADFSIFSQVENALHAKFHKTAVTENPLRHISYAIACDSGKALIAGFKLLL